MTDVVGHAVRVVRRPPHPALRGLVAGIVGMAESASGLVERRQPAGSLVPLVVSLRGALEIRETPEGVAVRHDAFVAGIQARPVATRFDGAHECVQVYLTPAGVLRILGIPGSDLANRIWSVRDEFALFDTSFVNELLGVEDWSVRLALVEARLLHMASRGRDLDDFVEWMWSQLQSRGGSARVGELVEGTGWSHRHVARRFSDQIGLTPKSAADLIRFEHAAADLRNATLAEVAVRHGYADQSHFSREVRRFAGETPRSLAAARRPTAHTAIGTDPWSEPAGRGA